METLEPGSPRELAEALERAAAASKSILLGGAFTKDAMGGPARDADVRISTRALNKLLQYEPRDLTVSVEAGMPFAELRRTLAANRQMVPLDPIFRDIATVGGVVAANCSGPRRRLYGTARDNVIGMQFATLEGKLVNSGGMVVKNVAGLDMAKLMIGSFGTLAAIAVVNFKLHPIPPHSRTFLRPFTSLDQAIWARDSVLRGVLQPAALDLLNPAASRRVGHDGWLLALSAGGNEQVMDRYSKEMPGAEVLEHDAEDLFWARIREFTPGFLEDHEGAAIVRVSSTLDKIGLGFEGVSGPMLARAATGVAWICFAQWQAAAAWAAGASERGLKAVVEFAPADRKRHMNLWPEPGGDFEIMKKVKNMFDPGQLLNRGRLYGRI